MEEMGVKKRMIKAGSIALGITTLMGIINYILGTIFEKIIGIKFWGGEMSSTYGFGIELFKSYPLYSVDNPIESNVAIHIAPVNFVLTVVMLSIVIYLICLFMEKNKK
ncbi:MAG: hypothetical protein E7257_05625 [Lachnospiraceae bacterium]|nr:hypothetical protein [Lachnospiraceae bacterium]